MLVLVRRLHQSLVIGDDVEVVILEIRGDQVRIGVRHPRNVAVHRKEIYDQIQAGNQFFEVRPEDVPS